MRVRTAVFTALLILFAAVGPTLGETVYDRLDADTVATQHLTVVQDSTFNGTITAQNILSPTIVRLLSEIVALSVENDALEARLAKLEARVRCVENKPNVVRPRC